jgi:hypothetical protein
MQPAPVLLTCRCNERYHLLAVAVLLTCQE